MINYSGNDTAGNIITAIEALPASTPQAPAAQVTAVKALAIETVTEVGAIAKVSKVNASIRINSIGLFRQIEIQIAGQILTLIAALLLSFSASAQTFGGGATVSGQTNAVLNPATTNSATFVPPSKTVTINNIWTTNQFYNIWYSVNIPGYTNQFPLFLFQTNSVNIGATNPGSMTFVINPPQVSLPATETMLFSNGNNGQFTNNIYVP